MTGPWTSSDVVAVGTVIDTWGRVNVTLRRGPIVQHVRVPEGTPVADAVATVAGRTT